MEEGKLIDTGSKKVIIEKCPNCESGTYVENEQESTHRENVFICDNCGYKITSPKQICPKCGEGKYILSDAHSTMWYKIYICDNCRDEVKKPTGITNIKDGIDALLNIATAAIKIYDIAVDISAKNSGEKGHGLYEFYSKVEVKGEYVSDFITATKANRDAARLEPGNIKYDIYQFEYDSTKFILHEIYKSEGAAKTHKETTHYLTWRDEVAPMMAKPRSRDINSIPFGYKLVS